MLIRIMQSFTVAAGPTLQSGQQFEANDVWAAELIAQGLARASAGPAVEVSAGPAPFEEQPSKGKRR